MYYITFGTVFVNITIRKQKLNTKLKDMKTLKNLTALIATLALMLSISLHAESSNFQLEEESYINDIPFNTETVVNELLMPEFDFEEESYIDDIPFNTECVSNNCKYQKAISINYELEDEAYINDIPFNTPEIADEVNYTSATNMEFEMEDEEYVNDIPFDTKSVVAMAKANKRELYVSGM